MMPDATTIPGKHTRDSGVIVKFWLFSVYSSNDPAWFYHTSLGTSTCHWSSFLILSTLQPTYPSSFKASYIYL